LKKSKTRSRKKPRILDQQKSSLFDGDSFWKFGFLTSFGLSLISILITYQFKAFSIFDTFLFARDDGWCEKETEGMFEHCFGDFHQGVAPNYASDPFPMTNDVMVLSIADKLIWKIGDLFYILIGPRLTLYLFLIIYIGAILVGWYILKKILKYNLWFFLFGVTSLPTILAVSRMNNICLVFPIFVLYLYAVQSKNDKKQIALLILCCLFKPQLGVLVVLDLINRDYRLFLTKVSLIASTIFVFVTLLYNFRITSIFEYIATLWNYSNSTEQISYFYPANVSVGNVFMVIYESLGYSVSESKVQINLSIIVLVTLISCVLYPASKKGIINLFPIFFLSVFGLSGVVQPYYLLLLNPIVLLTVFDGKASKSKSILMTNFLVANSFLIVPLLKQWEIVSHRYLFESYNQVVVYNLVPIFTTLIFALFAIRLHFKQINLRIFRNENQI